MSLNGSVSIFYDHDFNVGVFNKINQTSRRIRSLKNFRGSHQNYTLIPILSDGMSDQGGFVKGRISCHDSRWVTEVGLPTCRN